jgi:DNA polymerase III epsilon subunit-like protein
MPNTFIIDVESTGLPNEPWSRMYELAGVVLAPNGAVLSTFEALWRPDVLDARAERALARSGRTVADLEVLELRVADAHNKLVEFVAAFDIQETWSFNRVFDEGATARESFALPWPAQDGCVMRLARRNMQHKRKDPSLGEAMHFFGIPRCGGEHTALSDAAGAAGVYLRCRGQSPDPGWPVADTAPTQNTSIVQGREVVSMTPDFFVASAWSF